MCLYKDIMESEDEALNKATIKKTYWIYNDDMVLLDSRIKSFEGSNLKIKQTPQQLAEAGFYYMGLEDQCVCFHCGLGVEEWEPEDDPWFEHAFHTPHCAFLNLKKSELKFQIGEKEQVLPLEAMNQTEPLDIYLCKICQVNVANHVNMPCEHLVSCLECTTTQDECVICRSDIDGFVNIIV